MSDRAAANLRSERAALDRDRRSLTAQAEWWRAEAAESPTAVAASFARERASGRELLAVAKADRIAEVDKQLAQLDDVLIPFRPAVLTPDQCAAVDDMAGLEVPS